ncbi:hypothetical protein CK203_063323 [Vitis vinifera]|uniref:Uncharacterized protein n=1 Tax=Vitis vinifera TaxID=29760 RepID=A0A438G4Z6_VITVI|nr:hypothetical protein CK203_063323 [Vitis vinifera]
MLQWVEVMTQKCINKKHDWRKLPPQQMWSCGSSSRQDMHHFQLSGTGPHSKIIKMAWLIGYMQGLSYMASSQYAMPPINEEVSRVSRCCIWYLRSRWNDCASSGRNWNVAMSKHSSSGMAELYSPNSPQLEAESALAA